MRLITPKRLKENEDFMWRFADRRIDGFVDDGSCEFIGDYAEPFTLSVIADLEGVPESDHALFREPARRPVPRRTMAHKPLEFLYERFTDYIEDRRRAAAQRHPDRRSPPATFPDGSTPEVNDAALIAANLFAGGQETTVRLLVVRAPDARRAAGPAEARARRPRPHPQLHRGDAATREPAADAVPDGARRAPTSPASTSPPAARSCSLPGRATATRGCSRTRTSSTSTAPNAPAAHRVRPRHPHLRGRAARPRRGSGDDQPVPRPHDRHHDLRRATTARPAPAATTTCRRSSSAASSNCISTSRPHARAESFWRQGVRISAPVDARMASGGSRVGDSGGLDVDMMSFVCA